MKVFGVTLEKGKAYYMADGKCEELKAPEQPMRLSKFGEWAKAHPNGIGRVINERAVMR